MIIFNLNNLRDAAFKNACEKGFHDKEYSDKHFKCLIVSELMEAVEADRKGCRADWESFKMTDGSISFEESFERYIKDTVEDELADACIRIFDLAGLRGIELEGAVINSAINKNETLTEDIHDIVRNLTGVGLLQKRLTHALKRIFDLADRRGIDIKRHIILKMQYNETREYKHGKKY